MRKIIVAIGICLVGLAFGFATFKYGQSQTTTGGATGPIGQLGQAAPLALLQPPVAPQTIIPAVGTKDDKEASSQVVDLLTGRSASQATDISSKTNGIETVPGKIAIPSTKRFQIVVAIAAGEIKWLVFNSNKKQPVQWLPLPGTSCIQVFPNYEMDDEITVYAYSATAAGRPTDTVKCTITVSKGDVVTTPPDGDVSNEPTPKPPITPPADGPFYFTIISDKGLVASNPALASIINSGDLRAGIENRGCGFWVYDQVTDVDKIKEKSFDDTIRKVGKIPLYIIQNSQAEIVDSGPVPTTMISILAKLDKVLPKALRLK